MKILESEVQITAIRAQGAGGQNVNKVSSAIHLRFDITQSSLPELIKTRLLALSDHRITQDGVIVIKAQQFRTQDKNRQDAFERLSELVASVAVTPKLRRPTKPSFSAKQRRMKEKAVRSEVKSGRGRISDS
jgi:ribosome-associated protein